MTSWTLIWRSLRHHAPSHAGTWLGAAVGSAILTGALLVGDSVRGSLREMALARLGRTTLALSSGDRFFRSALADDLEAALQVAAAPLLELDAVATGADDSARANQVRLLGVDARFWRLGAAAPRFPSPGENEVVLNERLARQLRARPGDAVLLRVARPSAFSREAPLSPQEDSSRALRLTVCGVVSDDAMGRYSLQPSQVPPFNAFMDLRMLQVRLELAGRANQLLLAGGAIDAVAAQAAVRDLWQLADAELELRRVPGLDQLELRTRRVFLDEPVADAAANLTTNATRLVTYFVNELRAGARRTPYSMVTAADPPLAPSGLATNAILVNEWLAKDLEVGVGDEVALSYFVVGTARRLEERTARFRVHGVVPLAGTAADPTLMPEFPGIEQAESTRDWDPSLPVALARIREQDEHYWQQHRGTPKAFLALAAGEALWHNRFGTLTAVRFPVGEGDPATRLLELGTLLKQRLDPVMFGLQLEPVREEALKAAAQAQDFGGLFIGFSLFLIIAALLLMTLLYQFGIEQRSTEVGTLLALGFTGRQVRGLLLREGGLLALLGGVAGLLGGMAYARFMVHGLATVWRDAVGTSALEYHAAPATWIAGALAGTAVAGVTLWIALRRQAARPARELLAGDLESSSRRPDLRSNRAIWWATGGVLAALVLVVQAVWRGDTASAGAFFGAGALLLLSLLAAAALVLRRWMRRKSHPPRSILGLGWRQVLRRRNRSLTTLGLLACGSFLVAAVGVFRLNAVRGAWDRGAGTGGFAFVGESTFPVVQDLNSTAGQEFFALDPADLREVRVIPLRVRDGDDASCLNLNRAQQPRLVGVDPRLLAERGAFTFAKTVPRTTGTNAWGLLESWRESTAPGDEIPAIGDFNSIRWAMGRNVGDTLIYADERGREFRVRLVGAVANSILQGQLLIDEHAFLERFPSESGYRMFLVDAPSNQVAQVSAALMRGLRDVGLDLTLAAERLAAFNAVQNTYLGTFQLLGGLGLILGSVGLGVVVLRNVLERRGELGLLLAVGFRPGAVRRMILAEHAGLLLSGLGVGVLAAAVAVLPAVLSPAAEVPYRGLGLTLSGVVASGLTWTWLATRLALRGELLRALRNE